MGELDGLRGMDPRAEVRGGLGCLLQQAGPPSRSVTSMPHNLSRIRREQALGVGALATGEMSRQGHSASRGHTTEKAHSPWGN